MRPRAKSRVIQAIVACGILASVARAQPEAIDLGTLDLEGRLIGDASLVPQGVVWYRFTLATAISRADRTYLDLDSAESLLDGDNTVLALYAADGTLVASDDDDGPGLLSSLSFGIGSEERLPAGALESDGRDGDTLPAGEYYVGVTSAPATISTNFMMASTHANSGLIEVQVAAGTLPVPPADQWREVDDAGSLPAAAQSVTGTGPLGSIRGELLDAADVDLYRIHVCSTSPFTATLVLGAEFDTQMFLFTLDGMGVVFNDDSATTRQSTITEALIPGTGEYVLAVVGWDCDPVSESGLELWADQPFTGERAPDGPAATQPVAGWIGDGAFGRYTITLIGACFIDATPTCVADLDDGSGTGTPDGAVTIDDLLYYLGVFTSGDVAADVDDGSGTAAPDGAVTIDDLLYLLVRFQQGC